jgi:pheromone shutdown-related protein TraB
MKRHKNITLIGTSHIAIESVRKVKRAVMEGKPGIVAIELDKRRFVALMQKTKRKLRFRDIRKIGIKGFLFNFFGAWVENKLGKMVGIKPGADMRSAITSAKKVNAAIALVDQDIEITLKRLSKEITWREKFRFIGELIRGIVFRKKQAIEFDLTKVPSEKVIKKLTGKLKREYPSVHKVLIVERNNYMAKALYKLMTLKPEKEIIAVIGAGHEEDIINLIKKEHEIHAKRS